MQPIEIGRRMAQLGQKEDAQKAYTVALTKEELSPMERFEAASYIFFPRATTKRPTPPWWACTTKAISGRTSCTC